MLKKPRRSPANIRKRTMQLALSGVVAMAVAVPALTHESPVAAVSRGITAQIGPCDPMDPLNPCPSIPSTPPPPGGVTTTVDPLSTTTTVDPLSTTTTVDPLSTTTTVDPLSTTTTVDPLSTTTTVDPLSTTTTVDPLSTTTTAPVAVTTTVAPAATTTTEAPAQTTTTVVPTPTTPLLFAPDPTTTTIGAATSTTAPTTSTSGAPTTSTSSAPTPSSAAPESVIVSTARITDPSTGSLTSWDSRQIPPGGDLHDSMVKVGVDPGSANAVIEIAAQAGYMLTENFIVTTLTRSKYDYTPDPAELGTPFTIRVPGDAKLERSIYIASEPVFLGSAVADADGVLSLTVMIPANLVGDHHIVAIGKDADGTVRASVMPITIKAPDASAAPLAADSTTPADLAFTGTDAIGLGFIGLALIASGLVITRRRKLADKS